METAMHTLSQKQAVWVLLTGLALSPLLMLPASAAPPAPKTHEYIGKVVPLTGLLEKFGARLDRDAAAQWLALATEDGKVYPLIKDDGARLFFSDPRLRDRRVRLGGRLFGDTHLLQVLSVNSFVKGQWCEVYYWCEVCSIRRNEKLKQCECCGGPMELREVPLPK
jgi:hypothetical protein